ncbi:Pur operon repressor [Paraliobacillus sp. PM-2]|uniref:phosphoribosyltransferase family protein n=1 Tax=Paraliobacillus sp. PM-2 TaxID=1462524 RepID=UPI00061C3B2B|nr:phosphoribosyltransferase family protein [Paraliobacillus sp. PM-2]CQR45962.1 Pur operon repressor [Paraliobacillus sp. PM-2]
MKTYEINIKGIRRELPIVTVSEDLRIASFDILGDTALVTYLAPLLAENLPTIDYIVTAEAKGIPLIQEISKVLNMDKYIVARKSMKPYMQSPLIKKVTSITTQKEQTLCLDGKDASLIKGKRVAIIDDVISTGESIRGLEALLEEAGAHVLAKAAILAEGSAAEREDIIFLEKLPLF